MPCCTKTVSVYIPICFISLAFDLALPCYLEEGALVNVTLRWSQFQHDGQLIYRPFDLQFYRDCTPNTVKAAATTGLHELSLFDYNIHTLIYRGGG